jgi:capsular polysaccharide transport system permease protein
VRHRTRWHLAPGTDHSSCMIPQIPTGSPKSRSHPLSGIIGRLLSFIPEKYRAQSPREVWTHLYEFLKQHPSFAIIVVIPTTFAVLYFGLFASSVYVTESTFVLHSVAQPTASTGISSFLKGTGISGLNPADENLAAVTAFITSRDAMRELDEKLDLKKQWSRWWIDPIQRFSTFNFRKRYEYLYPYYKRHVTAEMEKESNLCTLTVRGFSAEQSLQINQLLLQAAEQLVNRLNERARQNMIDYAMREVESAQKMVKEASDKMTDQASKVAYASGPLAMKDAQYQQLVLDREFSKEQLASAMSSLQTARNQAIRQDLYLEVVSKPNLPDVAMEPKRLHDIFSVLAVSLLLWGGWTLFIAGVKEHQY